jgi:hypothetical protein
MLPTSTSITSIFVLKVAPNPISTSDRNRHSEPGKHLFCSGKKVKVLFYGLVVSCLFSTPFFPERCILLSFNIDAVG